MMHFRGREEDAIGWTERAEAAADVERDEESLLMARWIRALSFGARGRYREAWGTLDSIARIGCGEETFWHARVPNTYGALLADVAQYERALERDLESLERVRQSSARPVREAEVHTLLNLATDYLGLGRVGEARANVEGARRQIPEVEYARFRWLARLHFIDAEIAVVQGDVQRARGAAGSCLVLAAEYGLPKYEVRGRIAMAKALAAEGGGAAARKQARAAGRLADSHGFPALSWLAWRTASQAGGGADDKRRVEAAVAQVAAGLDEPTRADFLRVAGIRG
jgi:hypothetical protein